MRTATIASTALTVALLGYVAIAFVDHEWYRALARKDGHGTTGPIENLTVIVLLPGIVAALVALVRFWRRFPSPVHAAWLLMWTAASIYFAGEECSWGQWYLGFETPAPIAEINRQDEFNLHNTSRWLNQRPQFLVETFVIVTGLILPIAARLRPDSIIARHRWSPWILALPMCWAAAAYFTLVRVLELFREVYETVDSELRELAVAWFLTLYLTSYALRLMRPNRAHRTEP